MGEVIKAFWRTANNAFRLQFKLSAKSTSNVLITLDTGAVSTILGVEALFDLSILTERNKITLANEIMNSGVQSKPFLSASGDEMICYPCMLKNVYLGGFPLNKFYFYLYIGGKVSTTLLGCDFIRFCDIEKKSVNTIRLYNLDFESYESSFLNSIDSDNVFELNSLIKSCEAYDDARLYAGAFRELFKEQSDTKDK